MSNKTKKKNKPAVRELELRQRLNSVRRRRRQVAALEAVLEDILSDLEWDEVEVVCSLEQDFGVTDA